VSAYLKNDRMNVLVSGETYHVYNRGIDGRRLFLCKGDYYRFIHDLYEFNDEASVLNAKFHCSKGWLKRDEKDRKKRKLLVDILAFCLMPTHFHLMLRQRVDGGISKFMQKIGTGYARYFNTKLERKGGLFQGTYQVKLIDKENYFIYLPHYIHLNPLDCLGINWREGKVDDIKKAKDFLGSYRWSSYLDYVGKKNFPSIINREIVSEIIEDAGDYKKLIEDWLADMDMTKVEGVIMEV